MCWMACLPRAAWQAIAQTEFSRAARVAGRRGTACVRATHGYCGRASSGADSAALTPELVSRNPAVLCAEPVRVNRRSKLAARSGWRSSCGCASARNAVPSSWSMSRARTSGCAARHPARRLRSFPVDAGAGFAPPPRQSGCHEHGHCVPTCERRKLHAPGRARERRGLAGAPPWRREGAARFAV
jgi:hypothetical protein